MRTIDNKTAGFSLMEMLVSIVIGMIVVAAASTMLVNILKSQKNIAASANLNQQLGAAMAVMSNEIRRAGFSYCDIEKMHDAGLTCPKNEVGDEIPFLPYALEEDIIIADVDGDSDPDDGDCILYRYNADIDGVDDTEEHRGFRIKDNRIQMAGSAGDVLCNSDDNWEYLTDLNDIKITGLSFSSIGSKCRNMSGKFYWVVGDGAKELACAATTTPITCTDLNNPVTGICANTVDPTWVANTETLFGVNQIRITMQAELTRDSAVSKYLQTSVKVANPWIR